MNITQFPMRRPVDREKVQTELESCLATMLVKSALINTKIMESLADRAIDVISTEKIGELFGLALRGGDTRAALLTMFADVVKVESESLAAQQIEQEIDGIEREHEEKMRARRF